MAEKNLIDRLNKKIEIQERTAVDDGFGGFIEEWATLKSVWAEIKPTAMFEDFEADRIGEKITHIITTRYINSINSANRIKYKGRIFNIKGVINLFEESKILQLKVEEVI